MIPRPTLLPETRRILLVEDEYYVAEEIASALERRGAAVVGPFASAADALEAIGEDIVLDGAVLDINLRGATDFTVAAQLRERGVPFVFATGYDRSVLPPEYRGVELYEKPTDPNRIADAILGEEGWRSAVAKYPRNLLLSSLGSDDAELLRPHLVRVDLALFDVLQVPDAKPDHVYFLESGMASIIATRRSPDIRVEVGLVGEEGVSSPNLVLGVATSPYCTMMQSPAKALRIAASTFTDLLAASRTLASALQRYIHVLMVQTADSAVANVRARIDQRLARWLLMAHDRMGTPDLQLTHKLLSTMLGVRRAGVTDAIHLLEGEGLIRATRGTVIIRNRRGLLERAGEFYGRPEREFSRLFPEPFH